MHLWNAYDFFFMWKNTVHTVGTNWKQNVNKIYHTMQYNTVQVCSAAAVLNKQKNITS